MSELRKMILTDDGKCDYAMYEVLSKRMRSDLESIYNTHRPKAEFCDVLSEFLLYLRGEEEGTLYRRVAGIKSWFNFRSWIKTTFRNFLLDIIREEKTDEDAAIAASRERMNGYSHERDNKIHCLAMTIASLYGTATVRDMYIFIRGLIGTFGTHKMIGREELAPVLGLSYDNYRQVESRFKKKAMKLCADAFTDGVMPEVKPEHVGIVEDINNAFDNTLDEALVKIYYDLLNQLEAKKDIEELMKIPSMGDGEVRFRRRSNYNSSNERHAVGKRRIPDVVLDFSKLSIRQKLLRSFVSYCESD